MKLALHRLVLPLAHPFTIARGTITEQVSLVVELEHDGFSGFGEVSENSYYGHTYAALAAAVEQVRGLLDRYIDETPIAMWPEMLKAVGNNHFAASAIDIAAHDLRGKRLGIPTWQDWGLEWKDLPASSFTIGIDSIDMMLSKLAEQPGWPIYKIKLGTARDIDIVERLRQASSATFRVDANCGWNAQETIDNSIRLAELGVQFIEQPLPPNATRDEQLRIFNESNLPIIADESCQQKADVAACHGLFHGVNVKICKCGGLSPALDMLREARQLGMKTMVGCMIESSIGISGAAQLLPLLDYADLDGAVLLAQDPATGVRMDRGIVNLSSRYGCGAELLG
jgi:L-Ala-D/L-Glu epimerase